MSRVLPILFNTEMVQAILREPPHNKTATRRAVKGYIPQDAVFGYTAFTPKGYISCRGTFADGYGEKFFRLPCKRGDILYVRETWTYHEGAVVGIIFKARCPQKLAQTKTWRPSIHMPKKVARIWLKVTDVRVEHLQKMKMDDFLSEGIVIRPEAFNDPENAYQQAKTKFINIWDSTMKKSDRDQYGWYANPWVWVIEFERCEKPEDK